MTNPDATAKPIGENASVLDPTPHKTSRAFCYLARIGILKGLSFIVAGLVAAVGISFWTEWGPERFLACLLAAAVWSGAEWRVARSDLEWRFSRPGPIVGHWSVEGLYSRIIGLVVAALVLPLILVSSTETRKWMGDLWPYSLLLRVLAVLLLCYVTAAFIKTGYSRMWKIGIGFAGVSAAVFAFLWAEREFPSFWAVSQTLVAAIIVALLFFGEWVIPRLFMNRIS